MKTGVKKGAPTPHIGQDPIAREHERPPHRHALQGQREHTRGTLCETCTDDGWTVLGTVEWSPGLNLSNLGITGPSLSCGL